jgi:stage III sporulation protein AG
MKILSKWMAWWNEKKGKKEQWIILFMIGLLLVVIAMPSGTPSKENNETTQNTGTSQNIWENTGDTVELERKLEQILEQMDGVGKVSVMITLASSTEKVIEKEVENRNSTSREDDTTVTETTDTSESAVYTDTNDGSTPYVKQEISPKIQGVLVVAEGGDNAVTVQNITEVVQALFNVDTHKIRVMKHN